MLAASLGHFDAVSSGNTDLSPMLRLCAKSATQSHRTPVSYVERIAGVSDVTTSTREPQDIAFAMNQGKSINLIDMPCIRESRKPDEEYVTLYNSQFPQPNLVPWLIKSVDRALAADLHGHDTLVKPHCQQYRISLLVSTNL